MSQCGYTKTIAGSCQQDTQGREYCYYHQKVIAGLIETAEDEVLRDMPTLKERK